VRNGLVTPVSAIPTDEGVQVVDVRPAPLVQSHPLKPMRSINIPLPVLRQRLGELDRTRPVVTVCAFGKTAYFAARILAQNGFQVSTLTGGIRAHFDPRTPAKLPTA
jgi:rhodanese-related sulfurtransferase